MVEECPKIKIDDFLKRYRNRLKELMLSSEMEISGWRLEIATSKTHYNGLRLWFKCPICELRAGVVFKHPITNAIGCRQCLKLEYRKGDIRIWLKTTCRHSLKTIGYKCTQIHL